MPDFRAGARPFDRKRSRLHRRRRDPVELGDRPPSATPRGLFFQSSSAAGRGNLVWGRTFRPWRASS